VKWCIEFEKSVIKTLSKMQPKDANQIMDYLENIANLENPRQTGKALNAKYKGLWRYRTGDFRIICHIVDNELKILAVEVGHRKAIYKN